MAKEIQKNELYLIKHPRTGKEVEWSGDRIRAYSIINGTTVQFAENKKAENKKAAKKKTEPTAEPEAGKSDSEN